MHNNWSEKVKVVNSRWSTDVIEPRWRSYASWTNKCFTYVHCTVQNTAQNTWHYSNFKITKNVTDKPLVSDHQSAYEVLCEIADIVPGRIVKVPVGRADICQRFFIGLTEERRQTGQSKMIDWLTDWLAALLTDWFIDLFNTSLIQDWWCCKYQHVICSPKRL